MITNIFRVTEKVNAEDVDVDRSSTRRHKRKNSRDYLRPISEKQIDYSRRATCELCKCPQTGSGVYICFFKARKFLHQTFNSPPHPPSLCMRLRAMSDPVPIPSLFIISQPRRRITAWFVMHHNKTLLFEKNIDLILSRQPGLHRSTP